MKTKKYKILVLSDLKEKSALALRYAVKLSKEIDATVELFYAKAATELVQTENPLLAMRIMSDICNKTDKKIKDFISPISKENDINIKSTFAYGNVKNEINTCIKSSHPDLIILGERKPKRLKFLGDNITRLVNKNYKGVIFIATDDTILDSKGNVSLDNLGLKNNIANYNVKAKDQVTA